MKPLQELYRYAREENIAVDWFPLKTRQALSIMDEEGKCYVAIDPARITGEADERAKLAHELGHCATGAFYNQYSEFDSRQRQENKADKWAICQVVTEEELDDAVAQGKVTVWELAEYFGIPENLMRKAVCWYIYGNVAAEMYF